MKEELTGIEVTAKYGGTVSSVTTTAGTTVTAEDILATIDVTDLGYIAEISISSEYTDSLLMGDYYQVLMPNPVK